MKATIKKKVFVSRFANICLWLAAAVHHSRDRTRTAVVAAVQVGGCVEKSVDVPVSQSVEQIVDESRAAGRDRQRRGADCRCASARVSGKNGGADCHRAKTNKKHKNKNTTRTTTRVAWPASSGPVGPPSKTRNGLLWGPTVWIGMGFSGIFGGPIRKMAPNMGPFFSQFVRPFFGGRKIMSV